MNIGTSRPMVAALGLAAAAAATPALAHDSQAWGTVTVQGGLGGAWRASNELVLRTSDARGFYEVEDNLMVGYKVDKRVTLWAGYTFNPAYSHGSHLLNEHRLRQQVSFDNVVALGPIKLSGRLRLEQRWRQTFPGTAWRLRPQVKAALPLHGKTTLNLTHESFIDLNTTTFQRIGGEERMRNAIFVATPLTSRLVLDFGYLEQHGFVRNGPDTNDHVVTLGLTANF